MLPYGISDYKELQDSNLYFIDKTAFIPKIEQFPRFLFLIRPRRFGKSLFLSMLETYYDLQEKESFQDYFGKTYIGQNPTEDQGNYYVLRLDFSTIDSMDAHRSFTVYVNQQLRRFVEKYELDVVLEEASAIDNLNQVFSYGRLRQLPFYILIDEYDNFINELLVKDEQQYLAMVTGTEAVYKQFFKSLKAGTGGANAPVKRIFVTGVSPLAMFDLTSGFNIGTNITTDAQFNDLLGVTEQEVHALLEFFHLTGQRDLIFERIREWYNGYRFSKNIDHAIFNTDMILYYINSWVQNQHEPDELIDINVRSDYSKIRYLVQTDRKLNGNFSVLGNLLATGKVDALNIKSSFSAFEMRDRDHFVSLLFYLGLISIEGYEAGLIKLAIPNQTIRKILAEFMQKTMEENNLVDIRLHTFNRLVNDLAYHRKLEVFEYLGNQLGANSNIRDYISGENFIKGFLTAYLSLNPYFEVSTEKEFTKGFVDIYLHPITPDVPYGAAIELKYIKRNELDESLLKTKVAEAKAQLEKYGTPPNVVKILMVFHGWEMVACEEAGSEDSRQSLSRLAGK